ncbi:MAG TPA: MFS transporter [Gaiellaceae bacterium]|nr:MFS transporter [Gaiellaceae bacterium]
MTGALRVLDGRTFRSLRRHRNYRLFFSGQVVSVSGTWMQNVALAWLVIELTRSPVAVGALAVCRFLPFTVFGLVAGVVADRLDVRRLVIGTQAASMVLSSLLAGLALSGAASLPAVYVLAALLGVAQVFDAPGRQSLTYRMVGPEELPNAIALNSSLFNMSRVVGPAIAGVVIAAAGAGVCFVLNALSFLAVLASLLAMRADELVPAERGGRPTFLAGTREALAYVLRSHDVALVLAIVTTMSVVGFNFNVVLPLLASSTLRTGPGTFGALSASFGAGALTGALGAATLGRASWRALLAGLLGFSATMLALAPLHSAWACAAALFVLGGSFTLLTANANALVQLGVPGHLRGRVVALYLFAFAGLAPVGGLVAGWLVATGGTELAFGVAGATGMLVGAYAIRDRERLRASLAS